MAKQKEIPILFIKSKHEPYRRAGFGFSRAGVGIALSALTDEQIEVIKADPHLVVEEGSVAAEDAGDTPEQAEAARLAAEAAARADAEAKAKAEQEAAACEKAAAKAKGDGSKGKGGK